MKAGITCQGKFSGGPVPQNRPREDRRRRNSHDAPNREGLLALFPSSRNIPIALATDVLFAHARAAHRSARMIQSRSCSVWAGFHSDRNIPCEQSHGNVSEMEAMALTTKVTGWVDSRRRRKAP